MNILIRKNNEKSSLYGKKLKNNIRIAVSLNPILDPIKSAIFNTNFALINQFPRSQSLCSCDRQTQVRPTITAVRGSTATSNLRSNGPEIGAFDRALRYF